MEPLDCGKDCRHLLHDGDGDGVGESKLMEAGGLQKGMVPIKGLGDLGDLGLRALCNFDNFTTAMNNTITNWGNFGGEKKK